MSLQPHTLGHLPTMATRADSRAMDLVFILDTICNESTFKERCRFIRTIIQDVSRELQTDGELRVGIIPYGPHENLLLDSQSELIQMPLAPLNSDLNSIYQFLRTQKEQSGRGFEAAYEEALYVLHNLDWESSSHRILVTVGHRPPRPAKPWSQRVKDPFDCYYQESCEKNLDWRFLLSGIRSTLRIHSIALICQSTWLTNTKLTYADKYAKFCWKEIGYTMTRTFNPAPAAAKQMAQTLMELV